MGKGGLEMAHLRVALLGLRDCGVCSQQLQQAVAQLPEIELVSWPPNRPVHLLFLAGNLLELTAGDVCLISQYVWRAVALGRCAVSSLPGDLHLVTLEGCAPDVSLLIEAIIALFTEDRSSNPEE